MRYSMDKGGYKAIDIANAFIIDPNVTMLFKAVDELVALK